MISVKAAALTVILAVVGIAVVPVQAPAVRAAPAPRTFAIVNVVSGDTVRVATGNGIKSVRLIGVDTPEPGHCLAATATHFTGSFIQRQRVNQVRVVIPTGFVGRTDRLGRLMGYVQSRTSDLGTALLQHRVAIARYDSLDGYLHHPRQGLYRAISPGRASAPAVCILGPVAPPHPNPHADPHADPNAYTHAVRRRDGRGRG